MSARSNTCGSTRSTHSFGMMLLWTVPLHGRVPAAGGVQRADDWPGGVAAGLPDVAGCHDVHRAGLDVHRRTGRRRGESQPRVSVEVHALEGDHAGADLGRDVDVVVAVGRVAAAAADASPDERVAASPLDPDSVTAEIADVHVREVGAPQEA